MQISLPGFESVWLTITVPKAANGQGEPDISKAEFARRIQFARDSNDTPLIVNSGLASTVADTAVANTVKTAMEWNLMFIVMITWESCNR